MTKKRIGTMAACLALVGAVAVGGTLALLSTQSNTLTNTFAVGTDYPENALQLREHDVIQNLTSGTNYGGYVSKGEDNWKMTGGAYDDIDYREIVEGTTLDKDPQFHLVAGSPNSWIVAEITGVNELDSKLDVKAVETAGITGDWWFYDEDAEGGAEWVKVTEAAQIEDGYYMFDQQVAADGTTDPLFTQLVATNVVDTTGKAISLNDIEIKGVAVQAVTGSNFDDATKAEVLKVAKSVLK